MASSPPVLTPEMIAALQAGAANVGQKAQSGYLSSLFAPGALSPLDPLYNYEKTAPIYKLTGNSPTEKFDFMPIPNEQYRLNVNGKIVAEASTPEEAAQLAELYNQYSKQGGRDIYVGLERPVAGGQPGEFAAFYENQNNRDKIFETIMPAAFSLLGGAALGPLIQAGQAAGTATALGTGLGAGIGGTAGSLATGSNLKDALIKGAISGVAAGGLSALSGASGLGGGTVGATDIPFSSVAGLNVPAIALPAFAAPTVGSLGGAIAGSLPGEIIVSAARPAISGALSGIGGAALGTGINALTPSLSQIANPSLKDIADSYGQEQMDTITGVRTPPPSVAPTLVPVGGIANIFGPLDATGNMPTTEEAMAEAVGKRYPNEPSPLGDYLAVPVSAISGIGGTQEPELLSETTRPTGIKIPPVALTVPAVGAALAASGGAPMDLGGSYPEQTVTGSSNPPATVPPASIISGPLVVPPIPAIPPIAPPPTVAPPKTILDYLQGGLGALSVINGVGGLIGGGGNAGGAGGAGIGGNMGTYSYQPLNRTQNAPTFDPFTYGQNAGEFKFFNDAQPVYQTGIGAGAAGIAPPPRQPVALKEGGSVRKNMQPDYMKGTVNRKAQRAEDLPYMAGIGSLPTSWRDQLKDKLSEVIGRRNAEHAMTLADFTPAGAAFMGNEARNAYDRGDKGEAAAGLALATMPLPGPAKRGTAFLKPAIRANGKVYSSVVDHLSALSQIPDDAVRAAARMDGDNRGFVNDRGKYLDRFRAQEYAIANGLISPDAPSWAKTSPDLISENLMRYDRQIEPREYARGGHVRGIGGGQDDLIDARLSDGEYVISAQDVADLGDGSNEHGARRLDEMRRLIRKNAGRKNVKTIAKPQKSVSSLLRAVK